MQKHRSAESKPRNENETPALRARQQWTPMRGLAKALIYGSVVSVLLAAMCFGLIAVAPTIFLNSFLRVFIAVVMAWLVFGVVHNAAGMVGAICSCIACTFAALVMLSHHIGWAVFGAPISGEPELVAGWSRWFELGVIAFANISSVIGIGFATALCHSGVPGPDVSGYVANMPMWPGSRI